MDVYLSSLCNRPIPHLKAPHSAHGAAPPIFLEAKRYRELPFWRRQELEAARITRTEGVDENDVGGQDDDEGGQGDDKEKEQEEDIAHQWHDGRTFEKVLAGDIDLILDFSNLGLADAQCSLLRGASFLRLAEACMEEGRRRNSTRSPIAST